MDLLDSGFIMNSSKSFPMDKYKELLLILDIVIIAFYSEINLCKELHNQVHSSLEQELWDANLLKCLLWWVLVLKVKERLSVLTMITYKSAIWTDNSYSENNMLEVTNAKSHVEQVRESTRIVDINLSN